MSAQPEDLLFRHRKINRPPLRTLLLLPLLILLWTGRVAAQQQTIPEDERLVIHYHDPEKKYDQIGIWTWDATDEVTPPESEQEKFPVGFDDYGAIFVIDLTEYGLPGVPDQIGLLPRFQQNWDLKDGTDRTWNESLSNEIFMIKGDQRIYSERPDLSPRLVGAWIDEEDTVVVQLSTPVKASHVAGGDVTIEDDTGRSYGVVEVFTNTGSDETKFLRILLSESLPFLKQDLILKLAGYKGDVELIPRGVLSDPIRFYAPKAKLGAICTPDATTFRVFSPAARVAEVVLYDDATGPEGRRAIGLARQGKGIWEGSADGDLHGKYYMYRFEGPGFDPKAEAIDPYARGTSGNDGRGVVVDLDRTDPPGFSPRARPPLSSENNVVVYEIHVRDFSIHPQSGIEHKGKFLGFTEEGTHLEGSPEIKTGLDHLKELGVTHVQLLPIQDFDNNEFSEDYNWGYMPSHFNSPDGWYASSVRDLTRITEFKRLVQKLHDAGIRVIMDVVYNHTDNTVQFEKLVPGYYYRLTPDGRYSNGSGTGNEFKSENPMARKFIVDSCRYWAEEYGVDGFRFDLMALIDLETMIAVHDELKKVDSSILVWGEPWMAGPSMVPQASDHHSIQYTGLAAFNDQIRNLIKGAPRGPEGGFVQHGGSARGIEPHIAGSWQAQAGEPTEPLQYVTAHDDNVMWDKLLVSTGKVSDAERKKMQMMAAAILLTCQGKVFLHGGMEMLRTKKGVENSYNAPDDVNWIDWNWKKKNIEVFRYFQGLIAIRTGHPVFHLTTKEEITKRLSFHHHLPNDKAIAFTLDGNGLEGETWRTIHVIHNADAREHEFALPPGQWNVVVHDGVAGIETLASAEGEIAVPGRTSAILWKP